MVEFFCEQAKAKIRRCEAGEPWTDDAGTILFFPNTTEEVREAARHYDMLQFSGIRQIRTGIAHNALTESGHLNTMGILSLTRHPWYLAAILLVWTAYRSMDIATLITNVVLTAYLIVGTVLEERKLLVEFGEDYREYQKRVPMLVPGPWRRMMKSTEVEE